MEPPQSLQQEKALETFQWEMGPRRAQGPTANKETLFLSHSHACWGVTSLWNWIRSRNNEMAWKKVISYFSNVVTPSPLQVNRSWIQPMLQDTETGGSVVLRHGLVVRGNGQHGAQHGLTCPDRRQDHGHHRNSVVFCGCWLDWPWAVSSPGALGNHSQG